MKILDLGSGKHKVEGAFTVDVDASTNPDLVFDLNESYELLRTKLPHQKWDKIVCKNVVNYFKSYDVLQDFLYEVKYLLSDDGIIELEFMNIANKEGLRLHYLTIKTMLWDAGLESTLKTKRHWLIPTGNVKVLAIREIKTI